ncbi:NAD(P)H-binding protein [Actinoplanes solisilvae]|uniref:NmrA family NAD(P)-binding protein n=1 Tax=Actinoplanes solisilvae TaxID=2486853 RepID=UPI0013E3B192|nr:NAD(P)H-binding protein [Actinoplanes solisilvae]
MIVVTTPTGQIGRRVVELLRQADEPVRVIARDPAKVRGVDVVAGSHRDPAVLRKALDGARSLFLLVPPDRQSTDVTEQYVSYARAAAATASRIVAVSSIGRGYPEPAGALAAAWAMDDVIEASGADYRSLRPAYFMENLLAGAGMIRDEGVFPQPLDADRPLPLTATEDIAATAARLLRDSTWSGQDSVPLVSPDDLTPAGMAEVMADVLGRPVTYRQQSIAEYRSMLDGFGLSGSFVAALTEMARAQNDGVYGYGRQPAARTGTSFRDWLRTSSIAATPEGARTRVRPHS